MTGGPIIVQVFDSVLGKEISIPLVDGNDAVARFPARYSYVIANPYGNDNPLPATGLPSTSTLLTFELTVVFDSLLGVQVEMQQIDAIFATHKFPARYTWVSGAPVGDVPPPVPFNVGYTAIGGSNGTYSAGATCLGGGFTMPQDGVLQSISVHSRIATGATAFLGMYDNSGAGASPGLLLAKTASFVPGAVGFETHPALTNPLVSAGTVINIAVLAIGTTMGGKFDSVGPPKFYFDAGGDVTLPSTYPGGTTFTNVSISIYATFNSA